jgi:hypothetical protein
MSSAVCNTLGYISKLLVLGILPSNILTLDCITNIYNPMCISNLFIKGDLKEIIEHNTYYVEKRIGKLSICVYQDRQKTVYLCIPGSAENSLCVYTRISRKQSICVYQDRHPKLPVKCDIQIRRNLVSKWCIVYCC